MLTILKDRGATLFFFVKIFFNSNINFDTCIMILNPQELDFFEHSVREIAYRLRGHAEYLRGVHGYTEIISALALRYGISTEARVDAVHNDYGYTYRLGFIFKLSRSDKSAFFDMDIDYRGVIQNHGRGFRSSFDGHSLGRAYDIKITRETYPGEYQEKMYKHFIDPPHFELEMPKSMFKHFENLLGSNKKLIEKEKRKAERKAKYDLRMKYEALCKETGREVKDYKRVSWYTIEKSIEDMEAEKARHVLTMENLEFVLDNTATLDHTSYTIILNYFKKYGQNEK